MQSTLKRVTLQDIRLEHDRALDRSDGNSNEHFSRDVCQCCHRDTSEVDCLCSGLEWYQLTPGGAVECAAHRFKRLIDGEQRRRFWLFGRKG